MSIGHKKLHELLSNASNLCNANKDTKATQCKLLHTLESEYNLKILPDSKVQRMAYFDSTKTALIYAEIQYYFLLRIYAILIKSALLNLLVGLAY